MARAHGEDGRETATVVAAFSDLTEALAWMVASPVSMLLVPVTLDAEVPDT